MSHMMTLALAHQLLPGSSLVGDPALTFTRVHTDSRSVQTGDLFVALKGQHLDGHDFVSSIPNACVVQRGSAGLSLQALGRSGLEVEDTLAALALLAKNWRQHLAAQHPIAVIAVTGSNGKTTVTQMIGNILRAAHGEHALITQGNFNNHIGVPLTLLRLAAQHQSAVLELGMNHAGEIAQLALLVMPTIALVNNAQREHQEFMQTVQAVARENGSVIERLPADGIAVFPADDAFTPLWQTLAGARATLTFSAQAQVPADITAQYQWQGGAWQVSAMTPHGALHYTLHMAGLHNVKNSLAALACALAAQVPLACIAQGLSSFQPLAGRSRTVLLRHPFEAGESITLVDDTYNANPDSVIAAIDLLMSLPAPHLLVLGDMGEVGDQGAEFHAEVGAYARTRGVAALWTLGEQSRKAGGTHFASLHELQALLDKGCEASSILIKGSRFMKMERLVQHLERQFGRMTHVA